MVRSESISIPLNIHQPKSRYKLTGAILSNGETEIDLKRGELNHLSIDPGTASMGIYLGNRVSHQLFETAHFKQDDELYNRVTSYFEERIDLIKNVHIILIENQLPTNYKKVRLQQHILSYFLLRLVDHPCVIFEIAPKLKAYLRPEFKVLNTEAMKKAMVPAAIELLRELGDIEGASKIEVAKTIKARSDLSDAFVQSYMFHLTLE